MAQLHNPSPLESLLFQLGLLCELQTQARSAAHELAAAVAGAQLRRGRGLQRGVPGAVLVA
mgnify:CR=1 FL=1